ncbi:Clavaminate synthase-like protein [Schizopora paradoxa]|uniref:Clavaminate synthase-like protein n=1 Tax=Schizopora paradoxa TaxID=27342 RepID=A0A0H2S3S7_9AGAM|nr:Clavaminate synthase-like protein [Schizopora paradoxa]
MPATTLPPFPDNVQTHPLLVIDYELIKKGDANEIARLWKAATELGFWYLRNHGVGKEVDEMFDMGAETMALPLSEKLRFEQGDDGQSFGYKAAGANATDDAGNPDTVEFINVAKDDVLSFPAVTHRTYPDTVEVRMESTLKPFLTKSLEVTNKILEVFERQLGLPEGAFADRHKMLESSGSETRCIKNPAKRRPAPNAVTYEPTAADEEKAALGAHTDFGSISFLHNRLGGLQVLPPGYDTWQYVRPISGHAICNVGDTLTLLSGGILRSNLHRVVTPPGEQAFFERWSLVFFLRPSIDVPLYPLTKESDAIVDAVDHMTEDDKKRYYPVSDDGKASTAGEWFARRIKMQRLKNRTGPESYRASRGMEHNPKAI